MTPPAKNAADKARNKKNVKPAAGTAAAKPTTKTANKPEPERATIVQKRDFLARVADASGLSRAQARPIVEATLEQLGRAIADGETLALPPFGRARVARQRDTRGGEVIVVKLRRSADLTDKDA